MIFLLQCPLRMQNSQGNVSLDNNVLPCKLFSFACLKQAGKFPGGEEGAGREINLGMA